MDGVRLLTLKEDMDAANDPNHYGWCGVNNTIYTLYRQLWPKVAQTISRSGKDYPPWFVPVSQDYGVTVTPTDKALFSGIYDFLVSPTKLIGGPTPVSLGLVGSLYGIVLGYIGKWFVSRFMPEWAEILDVDKFPVVGAIVGATPGLGLGALKAIAAEGDLLERLKEFVKPLAKKAQTNTIRTTVGVELDPNIYIDENHWRDLVLRDPFLTRQEKALSTAPIFAAGLANNSRWVNILDVGRVTAGSSLGGPYGIALASLAAKVLNTSPDTRYVLVESGKFADLVRSVIGPEENREL